MLTVFRTNIPIVAHFKSEWQSGVAGLKSLYHVVLTIELTSRQATATYTGQLSFAFNFLRLANEPQTD